MPPNIIKLVTDAVRVSKLSNMKHKLGAVILDNRGNCFKGHNSFISDDISIHAEVDAITKFLKYHKMYGDFYKEFVTERNSKPKYKRCPVSATMVVVRTNKNGALLPSAPCGHCFKTITLCITFLKVKLETFHIGSNGDVVGLDNSPSLYQTPETCRFTIGRYTVEKRNKPTSL